MGIYTIDMHCVFVDVAHQWRESYLIYISIYVCIRICNCIYLSIDIYILDG